MAFKKIANGDYYYFTQHSGTEFIVPHAYKYPVSRPKGRIVISCTTCPGELIGKRVRLKLEIVEEKEEKQ